MDRTKTNIIETKVAYEEIFDSPTSSDSFRKKIHETKVDCLEAF